MPGVELLERVYTIVMVMMAIGRLWRRRSRAMAEAMGIP
jgi:hypothetical protein